MSGPDVWELSRSFSTHAARALVKKSGVRITPDVLLSAMEWANDAGIERLVAIIDLAAAFAVTRSRGWNIRMTGLLPLDTGDDGPIIGVEFANTAADIEAGRRMAGRSGRASYFVTPEDVTTFGSLANIEQEFALVRADGHLMPGEGGHLQEISNVWSGEAQRCPFIPANWPPSQPICRV